MAETPEHARGGRCRLGEERVVEAGREDRDAHGQSRLAPAVRSRLRPGLDADGARRCAPRGSRRRHREDRARTRRRPRRCAATTVSAEAPPSCREQEREPLLAEELARVPALGHAIRPEREQVARREVRRVVVELGPHVDAEQRAADARLLDLGRVLAQHQRRRVTRAGDGDVVAAVDGSQQRERSRAELARVVVAEDRLVRDLQDAARRALVARRDAHGVPRQRRQRGRSRTLACDVADREREAVGDRPDVVEVAADLGAEARGPVARGDLHARGLQAASPAGGPAGACVRSRAGRRTAARCRWRARPGVRGPARPPDRPPRTAARTRRPPA